MEFDPKKLVEKAKKPAKDALRLHPFYKGKVEVVGKCVVRSLDDFAIWYTPGVAAPCREIHADPEKAWEHTNRGNFVAVVSNGTRVLGLGNIGPLAAMPVMEGKALLFKYLGGVDAFPVCIDARDPDKFIEIVKALEPTFGGINLEDIEQPQCFYILERLREEMEIPVWHDDQQGTAAVTVAGFLNALKIVDKKINEVKVVLYGAGAANIRIAYQLFLAGVDPKKTILIDSKGTLHQGRIDEFKAKGFKDKAYMAEVTNGEQIVGGLAEAIEGADFLIAATTSRSPDDPPLIPPELIKRMARDPVIFAEANPVPEIWPWEAKAAGARIVATGRSDFPNQVNNSLGFPGIFRGALDVRAKTITDEMCLAAAEALAEVAEKKGLHEDYIIPTMEDWEVFPYEAAKVAMKAIEQGVARLKKDWDTVYKEAEEKIRRAREQLQILMKEGIVPPPPEE